MLYTYQDRPRKTGPVLVMNTVILNEAKDPGSEGSEVFAQPDSSSRRLLPPVVNSPATSTGVDLGSQNDSENNKVVHKISEK